MLSRRRLLTRVLAALLAGFALLAAQKLGLLDKLGVPAMGDRLDWNSDYPLIQHLRQRVVQDGLTHDRTDCLLFSINGDDPPDAVRMRVLEKHSGTCPGAKGELPLLFTLKVDRIAHTVQSDAGSPGLFHPLP